MVCRLGIGKTGVLYGWSVGKIGVLYDWLVGKIGVLYDWSVDKLESCMIGMQTGNRQDWSPV